MIVRITGTLAVAACLLVGSACANHQSGIVWGADAFDRTVTIGDEIYRVTPQTRLYDVDGTRILFHGIPTAGDPGIGLRNAAFAEVRFEPESERERDLRTLQVLHRPPHRLR